MARHRPIRDSIRFGYAVGRVRVLETRLLKRSQYERLLDARSFEEQRRILSETVYGAYIESARSAEDVEVALDVVLADLYADFLETANLPEGLVAYFRTMHDFENLRGRLKADALGVDAAELLNDLGSVRAGGASKGSVAKRMLAVEHRVRADAGVDGELDASRVDVAVDRELYVVLDEIAHESANSHVHRIAHTMADLASLKAFVRMRARGATPDELAEGVIAGGTIKVGDLLAQSRVPLADAVARLASRPTLRGAQPEALADPQRFDIAADAIVLVQLREASRVAVGPEPVVAYVLQRKFEASMLRMLLIGKIAGVSRDVLRTRLRDVA